MSDRSKYKPSHGGRHGSNPNASRQARGNMVKIGSATYADAAIGKYGSAVSSLQTAKTQASILAGLSRPKGIPPINEAANIGGLVSRAQGLKGGATKTKSAGENLKGMKPKLPKTTYSNDDMSRMYWDNYLGGKFGKSDHQKEVDKRNKAFNKKWKKLKKMYPPVTYTPAEAQQVSDYSRLTKKQKELWRKQHPELAKKMYDNAMYNYINHGAIRGSIISAASFGMFRKNPDAQYIREYTGKKKITVKGAGKEINNALRGTEEATAYVGDIIDPTMVAGGVGVFLKGGKVVHATTTMSKINKVNPGKVKVIGDGKILNIKPGKGVVSHKTGTKTTINDPDKVIAGTKAGETGAKAGVDTASKADDTTKGAVKTTSKTTTKEPKVKSPETKTPKDTKPKSETPKSSGSDKPKAKPKADTKKNDITKPKEEPKTNEPTKQKPDETKNNNPQRQEPTREEPKTSEPNKVEDKNPAEPRKEEPVRTEKQQSPKEEPTRVERTKPATEKPTEVKPKDNVAQTKKAETSSNEVLDLDKARAEKKTQNDETRPVKENSEVINLDDVRASKETQTTKTTDTVRPAENNREVINPRQTQQSAYTASTPYADPFMGERIAGSRTLGESLRNAENKFVDGHSHTVEHDRFSRTSKVEGPSTTIEKYDSKIKENDARIKELEEKSYIDGDNLGTNANKDIKTLKEEHVKTEKELDKLKQEQKALKEEQIKRYDKAIEEQKAKTKTANDDVDKFVENNKMDDIDPKNTTVKEIKEKNAEYDKLSEKAKEEQRKLDDLKDRRNNLLDESKSGKDLEKKMETNMDRMFPEKPFEGKAEDIFDSARRNAETRRPERPFADKADDIFDAARRNAGEKPKEHVFSKDEIGRAMEHDNVIEMPKPKERSFNYPEKMAATEKADDVSFDDLDVVFKDPNLENVRSRTPEKSITEPEVESLNDKLYDVLEDGTEVPYREGPTSKSPNRKPEDFSDPILGERVHGRDGSRTVGDNLRGGERNGKTSFDEPHSHSAEHDRHPKTDGKQESSHKPTEEKTKPVKEEGKPSDKAPEKETPSDKPKNTNYDYEHKTPEPVSSYDDVVRVSENPLENGGIKELVDTAIDSERGMYHEMVSMTGVQKKPVPHEIEEEFVKKFSGGKYSVLEQGASRFPCAPDEIPIIDSHTTFVHIKNYYGPVSQRLYVHCEYEDAYKLISKFADKADGKNMPFYVKTSVNTDGWNKFALKRDESIVFYGNEDNIADYINILRDVSKENPDIKFYEPPKTTGKIDGWIGHTEEPVVLQPNGKNYSYNSLRAEIIDKSTEKGINRSVAQTKDIQVDGKTIGEHYSDDVVDLIKTKYDITDSDTLAGIEKAIRDPKRIVSSENGGVKIITDTKSGQKAFHISETDQKSIRSHMSKVMSKNPESAKIMDRNISEEYVDRCLEKKVDPDSFTRNISDSDKARLTDPKVKEETIRSTEKRMQKSDQPDVKPKDDSVHKPTEEKTKPVKEEGKPSDKAPEKEMPSEKTSNKPDNTPPDDPDPKKSNKPNKQSNDASPDNSNIEKPEKDVTNSDEVPNITEEDKKLFDELLGKDGSSVGKKDLQTLKSDRSKTIKDINDINERRAAIKERRAELLGKLRQKYGDRGPHTNLEEDVKIYDPHRINKEFIMDKVFGKGDYFADGRKWQAEYKELTGEKELLDNMYWAKQDKLLDLDKKISSYDELPSKPEIVKSTPDDKVIDIRDYRETFDSPSYKQAAAEKADDISYEDLDIVYRDEPEIMPKETSPKPDTPKKPAEDIPTNPEKDEFVDMIDELVDDPKLVERAKKVPEYEKTLDSYKVKFKEKYGHSYDDVVDGKIPEKELAPDEIKKADAIWEQEGKILQERKNVFEEAVEKSEGGQTTDFGHYDEIPNDTKIPDDEISYDDLDVLYSNEPAKEVQTPKTSTDDFLERSQKIKEDEMKFRDDFKKRFGHDLEDVKSGKVKVDEKEQMWADAYQKEIDGDKVKFRRDYIEEIRKPKEKIPDEPSIDDLLKDPTLKDVENPKVDLSDGKPATDEINFDDLDIVYRDEPVKEAQTPRITTDDFLERAQKIKEDEMKFRDDFKKRFGHDLEDVKSGKVKVDEKEKMWADAYQKEIDGDKVKFRRDYIEEIRKPKEKIPDEPSIDDLLKDPTLKDVENPKVDLSDGKPVTDEIYLDDLIDEVPETKINNSPKKTPAVPEEPTKSPKERFQETRDKVQKRMEQDGIAKPRREAIKYKQDLVDSMEDNLVREQHRLHEKYDADIPDEAQRKLEKQATDYEKEVIDLDKAKGSFEKDYGVPYDEYKTLGEEAKEKAVKTVKEHPIKASATAGAGVGTAYWAATETFGDGASPEAQPSTPSEPSNYDGLSDTFEDLSEDINDTIEEVTDDVKTEVENQSETPEVDETSEVEETPAEQTNDDYSSYSGSTGGGSSSHGRDSGHSGGNNKQPKSEKPHKDKTKTEPKKPSTPSKPDKPTTPEKPVEPEPTTPEQPVEDSTQQEPTIETPTNDNQNNNNPSTNTSNDNNNEEDINTSNEKKPSTTISKTKKTNNKSNSTYNKSNERESYKKYDEYEQEELDEEIEDITSDLTPEEEINETPEVKEEPKVVKKEVKTEKPKTEENNSSGIGLKTAVIGGTAAIVGGGVAAGVAINKKKKEKEEDDEFGYASGSMYE